MSWGHLISVGAACRAPILLFVSAVFVFAANTVNPARADCTQNGSDVTCAPPGTGGFVAPTGHLTVTVEPGATVQDDGTLAILIKGHSNVINNGTITTADGTFGIIADAGKDNNTITNNGTITAGNFAAGIVVNNKNVITNGGNIAAGTESFGIIAVNKNTITNFGSITVGNGSIFIPAAGILARDNNAILNLGAINVGGFQAAGISVRDDNASVVNNGTITAGPTSPGIVGRDRNTITNNGTITTANDNSGNGAGILVRNGNTVINNGTVSGGDSNGTAGISGLGIAFATGNTIINNGMIAVGTYGISLAAADGFRANGNTIVNNGTIDGRVRLRSDGNIGSSNSFTNSGLLTITDGNTPYTRHRIDGSFTQTATGMLALRVAGDGDHDKLKINADAASDTVTLGGTLKAVVKGTGFQDTQTYLNVVKFCPCFGATIQDEFDTVTASSLFFTATAAYNATSVDLTLTRVPFGAVPGLTPNERAVGNALEHGYSPDYAPDSTAGTFYAKVFSATSPEVLDALSGQGTSAAQGASFLAGKLFNLAMMQQVMLWLNGNGGVSTATGALPYANADKGQPSSEAFAAMLPQPIEPGLWRAWALGFGANQTVFGDSSEKIAEQTQRTSGGAVGVEHQISPDLLVGMAGGGSASSFSASSLSTSGRVDAGHVGLYAMKTWGPAYLAAAVSYARLDNATDRTIAGAGATEYVSGDFAADQVSARIELGRAYQFGGARVTPFVAIEPAALWQHAYSETSTVAGGGTGVLGLDYNANTVTSLPSFLGAQIDTRYVFAGGQVLIPTLRAAWVHEFNPDRQVEASFISVPFTDFTVDGARAGSDALRVSAGATLALNSDAALFANLEGEFSDSDRFYAATAGVRLRW